MFVEHNRSFVAAQTTSPDHRMAAEGADRLLADLGIAYVVPKSKLKDFLSRDLPSDAANEQIKSLDDVDVKAEDKPMPDNVGGVAFELYYGKNKQTLKPSSISNKEGVPVFETEPPPDT